MVWNSQKQHKHFVGLDEWRPCWSITFFSNSDCVAGPSWTVVIFLFLSRKIKQIFWKKKKVWCMQCYRWKSHFNRHLPRWLFETVSLHLYVSKGPLTWLIRGSLVWEMKLHVSQGASSTPSWGPNLNQGHSFLHLQHRSTAPGAVS